MPPLHTDEEYARGTKYGQRILHGLGAFPIAGGLEMALRCKIGSARPFLGSVTGIPGSRADR